MMNKNRAFLACGVTMALAATGYVVIAPSPQPAAEEIRVAQGRRSRPAAEQTPAPTRGARNSTPHTDPFVRADAPTPSRPSGGRRNRENRGNRQRVVKQRPPAG